MKTITIRSGNKDETGLVLHTVAINGTVQYRGLDFTTATKQAHQIAENGDTIQQADGSQDPSHSKVYPATT